MKQALQKADKAKRIFSGKILLAYIGCVIGFCVWFNAFYNILAHRSIWPYPTIERGIAGICLHSLPTIIYILINTIVVLKLDVRIRIVPIKILADIIFSGIGVTLANLGFIGIIRLLGKIPLVDWAELYMVDFLILLVHEVAYFIIGFRLAEWKANKAKSDMAKLQYDVLKAQVNPHFLFNSLNLLYSLNSIDSEKAQKFILSLAKLYNYIMRQHEHQRVSLTEELNQLNFYIEVLKMRYWQQFEVEINGKDNISGKMIVPASLQMLMENVTKHNTIQAETPMRVTIDIFPDRVVMSNPVRPKLMADGSTSGIGLRYLKQVYGDKSDMFNYTNRDGIFTVVVPLLDSQS